MLCDVCKCNDAAVFLTQILEENAEGKPLRCLLEGKGRAGSNRLCPRRLIVRHRRCRRRSRRAAPTQKCPVCGFTQTDFKKTGRLGCSACYDTFSEGLGTLLKAMHKGVEHVGKLPERAARQMQLTDKMRALNDHLEKAVAEENYETAATLRDQIKQLEHEMAS